MPYRDPEKQKAYQREWQREQRATRLFSPMNRTLNQAELKTAQGILDMLSEIMAQLMANGGDLYMKARTIAYVASVGLRAVETAELERRITELENRIAEKTN